MVDQNYVRELEGQVSELTRQNSELENKLIAQKLSDQDRISTMAHEIKNPTGAIAGFTEIMLGKINEGDCENLEEYSGYIANSTKALCDLVDTINNPEQKKSNQTKNFHFFKLSELIEGIYKISKGRKDFKDIEFKYNPDDFSNIAFKDVDSLQSDYKIAIKNAIVNAFEASSKGDGIYVDIKEGIDSYNVVVRNKGKLTDSQLEDFFEENNSTKGTNGFGTYIMKKLTKQNCGDVKVENFYDQKHNEDQVKVTIEISKEYVKELKNSSIDYEFGMSLKKAAELGYKPQELANQQTKNVA
jgi:signal transduction histidine kinase